ncbi:MAG: glycosyltransferase family 2 protein [Clostridia bacterium]|nr:glycosyltransferase family 2 protein [Clostridia bacterium]
MPLVSVIVPIYNVENYLKKCVESILNQSHKNLEVILVDDGSTDSCPQICDNFAKFDNRVKVIHKENGGQGSARNLGIDIAKGEYILFVDSDDYIAKNTVELTLNKAKKHNADMVIFDYASVYENGEEFYRMNQPFEKEVSLNPKTDKIMITANPSPVTQLYKKSIFDDKEMRFMANVIYEDLRLMPKLFEKCNCIVYIDSDPLYFYLCRNNSTMHNGNIEKTKTQRIAAMQDVTDYFKQKNIYNFYQEEIEWMWIYHGFYLPAMEILRFKGKSATAINRLRCVMKQNVSHPLKNKYFYTFSKKARLVCGLLYYRLYFVVKLILKLR